jgi:hypothetical protein
VIDRQRIQGLLADLNSDRFEVRDRASRELIRLGEQVDLFLRELLVGKPPLEVRKRIEAIREEILLTARGVVLPGETLRSLRAIQVLERIGSEEALRILDRLAKGASEARLTREAKASLQRLARRPAARL